MNNITTITNGQSAPSFLSEGRRKFTPAQAGWVFNNLRYEFNRNERQAKSHISALSRMMRSGVWRSGGAIEFARLPDGEVVLLDGHHRMLAQVDAGVDVVWNVVIHEVQDKAQVRDLFWTYDTILRKRSLNNVLNGVQAAENLGLGRLMATSTARAAHFIANGMRANSGPENKTFTPDETIRLCSKWAIEAQLYEQCIDAAPHKMKHKMRSSQICAAAIVTFNADSETAWSFWMGIALDDGLRRGDPRKTFIDWMRDTHLAGSGYTASCVAAARCWNAYVAGSELSVLRIGKRSVRFAKSRYEVTA